MFVLRQRANLIRVAHARKKRECEEGKHAKYPTLKKREILTDLEMAQHNCKGEFGRKNLPVHSLLCK